MLYHPRNSAPTPAHEISLEEEQFARRKTVLTVLMLFAVAFSAVQLPTMHAVLDATTTAMGIWAVRILVIGATLLLALRVPRTQARRGFRRIAAVWSAGLIASVVLENRFMPLGHTAFVAWDVFFVFTLYTVVPLSIGRRAALATILTLTDLLVVLEGMPAGGWSAVVNIALAYVCANMVGLFVAWEIGRWRRQQFLALTSEREARRQLEAALAEIRTLRGIIPICSFCKNVRNDEGWHEIEEYVRCHSDAEFSHGVCPPCMKEHYPHVTVRE